MPITWKVKDKIRNFEKYAGKCGIVGRGGNSTRPRGMGMGKVNRRSK